MRLTDQFTLSWAQVKFDRRLIRLTKTKNGSARNVPLNSVALAALESQRAMVTHKAATPGMATDTHSAHGLRWPGLNQGDSSPGRP
jgi:integrase